MKSWNGMGAVAAAIGLSLVAAGQTTTPTTCTTPPTSVTALQIEHAVPLANILTTLTPAIPPSILAAIAGGALEIRVLDVYNPQLGITTATVFVVPSGSPLPSPLSAITAANIVTVVTVTVSQILTSCMPTPSLMFIGTISSVVGNPYGVSSIGAPTTLSLGYTLDSPAKIHDVTVTSAGLVTLYSSSAAGTLTVPAAPSKGGGGGGGTGPTIVVKLADGSKATLGSTVQVPFSPLFLDASGSSSSGGALTFAWTTTSNSPVAFVGTGVPGQILVQFPSAGDYLIKLTVTDASGASATFILTATYTGRPQ
jgi:hypothetical protein